MSWAAEGVRCRRLNTTDRGCSDSAAESRTRQEIIDLLGRAAVQAQHAEDYHAAARGLGGLEGQADRQVACDAARCR
jgi:hypothetical protein